MFWDSWGVRGTSRVLALERRLSAVRGARLLWKFKTALALLSS